MTPLEDYLAGKIDGDEAITRELWGKSKHQQKVKFYICGYARHGKDTAAEIINKITGLKYESSSWFACKLFIFDTIKDKYNYLTANDCFRDRVNRRQEWHELIREYNKGDESRLSRAIFETNDMYVGCRAWQEIDYSIADFVLWIDASGRKAVEDSSSINITKAHADIITENNFTPRDFKEKLERFCRLL